MASEHEHEHHHHHDNHHRKVTVFGGGTFATAVGTLFARNGFQIILLVRDPAVIKSINEEHKNIKYMPEYKLLPNVSATDDPHAALDKAEFIVHAVPVQASTAFLEGVAPFVPKGVPLVSLSKGIHLETLKFMCDIFRDALGPEQPTAYLSGPSFARELMDEQPTGLVAASENHDIAVKLQHALSSSRVRVYTSTAVLAVELGGALKNIYAIASGVSEGMGFRLNAAALLITRACSEIRKLAAAMNADAATINGLAGMGDLMLTCFGPASRNRTVGVRLGKGEKLQAILGSMSEVAEGVPTAGAVIKLADKFGLDLPLARGVAEILEGADPHPVLNRLMKLPLRPED